MAQVPTNYDEAYAKAAEGYARQDRSGEGSFFSTRGGMLMLGEERMPNDQIACVIVDSYLENAYFPDQYNPQSKKPPTCFAFSRDDPDNMYPHLESMVRDQTYFMPQNFDAAGNVLGCNGCPMAEWGTSRTGKGKACKNTYRLSLVMAGIYQPIPNNPNAPPQLGLFDDPGHYSSSSIYHLKVPVTSGAIFERYRRMLRIEHARPPYGAVTRVFLTPHPKNQFEMNFELIELLPNELAPAILSRNAECVGQPFVGYEAPDPNAQGMNQPNMGGVAPFGSGQSFRR